MEVSEETQTKLGWDDVAARIVIGLTVLAVVAFLVGLGIAMGWWAAFFCGVIAVLVVAFLIGGWMEKWLYETCAAVEAQTMGCPICEGGQGSACSDHFL